MNDGSEEEFGRGDIMMFPPGHDAWTVGDEACVFIEFSAGTTTTRTSHHAPTLRAGLHDDCKMGYEPKVNCLNQGSTLP